jgi:hypothetical protein
MKWRVVLKLVGPDGTVGVHEVGGRATVAEYASPTIGLTLDEGKHRLLAVQVPLVQAQLPHRDQKIRLNQLPEGLISI